jgi:hypothetical protein
MTIALVVKVNDGYVLASDSATTVTEHTPQGQVSVQNIYNNANKIFNLHKGLPISAMTWGQGNVGPASISTLAKDFRVRLTSGDPAWKIKPDNYTMTEVATRFKKFFYDEHYKPFAKARQQNGEPIDSLGLSVAGYSSGADQPEIFHLDLAPTGCTGPAEILVDTPGAQWWGQGEAIVRLLNGVSYSTPEALKILKLATDDAEALAVTNDIINQMRLASSDRPCPSRMRST